ncbi:hypothetical protein [Georgenia sp. SUBG003]|uniref:hypothetical protein n=1 Tax=Georgenia sp. SUBG003 TaxID=1497974 RepID=UPI000694CD1B
MTAQSTAVPEVRTGLFRRLGRGLRKAARKVTSAVRGITTRFRRRVDEPETPVEGAVIEGVAATVEGKNPLWGAVKGAWHGLSVPWRIAVVAIALLVVLLAPVVAVVLLLVLLVLAIVAAVRGRSTAPQAA